MKKIHIEIGEDLRALLLLLIIAICVNIIMSNTQTNDQEMIDEYEQALRQVEEQLRHVEHEMHNLRLAGVESYQRTRSHTRH